MKLGRTLLAWDEAKGRIIDDHEANHEHAAVLIARFGFIPIQRKFDLRPASVPSIFAANTNAQSQIKTRAAWSPSGDLRLSANQTCWPAPGMAPWSAH